MAKSVITIYCSYTVVLNMHSFFCLECPSLVTGKTVKIVDGFRHNLYMGTQNRM